MDEPAIQTHDLSKRYGRHPALRHLDLVVPRGCIFGYLGPNGAGKTTTLRLLVGLLRPSAGTAVVLGIDVAKERDRAQRQIGFLPGIFSGYADLTGHQFLEFLAALRGDVSPTYVAALAERLDLDLTRRIGALSHGNRQKVGILQAFMHRPELVILDEPTSGLDPLVQREFLELLRETRRDGRTVLLSSHVLSEVEEVADHVAIIGDGRLLVSRGIADLTAGKQRRLDLVFQDRVPAEVLRTASGVRDVQVDGLTARVAVAGSLAGLVRAAAPFGVVDVVSHESDLTALFLDLYKTIGDDDDPQRVPEVDVGSTARPARLG